MKVAENQRYDNQPSTSRKVLGITTGAAVGLCPYAIIIKNNIKPITQESIAKRKKRMAKKMNELGDFATIKGYADDIIQKNGLAAKKVQIVVITPKNIENLKPLPPNSSFVKRFLYTQINNRLKIFANGLNACFDPKKNIIIISNQGLHSAVFHEIGHAMSYHCNKASKAIQLLSIKMKKVSQIIALTCLGLGLFGNKKPLKQEDKRTKIKKIKDFVHDNAGKITFLTFLPLLIEEGKASIKGANLAKPYLTKTQHKQHIKNLFFGSFCSYLKGASLMSGAVALGIFVKDKIVNHKRQIKTGGNQ